MADHALIRPARREDLAAVEQIVGAAYAHYVPRIGVKPGPLREDYAALIASGVVEVLEDQGQVCAILVLVPEEDSLLLDNIAVAPGAQGRGFGQRLIAHTEARARALRLGIVRLYTHEKMVENIALYARIGFVETRRAEENGLARVFMEKRLI